MWIFVGILRCSKLQEIERRNLFAGTRGENTHPKKSLQQVPSSIQSTRSREKWQRWKPWGKCCSPSRRALTCQDVFHFLSQDVFHFFWSQNPWLPAIVRLPKTTRVFPAGPRGSALPRSPREVRGAGGLLAHRAARAPGDPPQAASPGGTILREAPWAPGSRWSPRLTPDG